MDYPLSLFAFPHLTRLTTPVYAASWPTHVRPTGEGGGLSRRFFPTSFTHHAIAYSSPASWESASPSPVPFRGSCFTPGLHPPAATPQRLIACLYGRWDY